MSFDKLRTEYEQAHFIEKEGKCASILKHFLHHLAATRNKQISVTSKLNAHHQKVRDWLEIQRKAEIVLSETLVETSKMHRSLVFKLLATSFLRKTN